MLWGMTGQGINEPARLETLRSAEEVLATLDALARRGKLPGFVVGPGGVEGAADGTSAPPEAAPPETATRGQWLFAVDAFSSPFDGQVRAWVDRGTGQAGTGLTFEVRLKPLWPAVFVVSMLLAIWPGVVLTESLLASFFPHTPWTWVYTWWWYMPLSIAGTPFAIHDAIGRSRKGAAASAQEVIGELRAALEGRA